MWKLWKIIIEWYTIMKHKEIIAILSLVAFAFLLVGILQYFNLYEGLESGTTPAPEAEAKVEAAPVPEKKDDKATIIKYNF
jgi:hypothetical protein